MESAQWNRFNGVESMESHTKCQRLDDSCEKFFTVSKWVCKKWKKWKSSTFFKTAFAIPGRAAVLTASPFVYVSVPPLGSIVLHTVLPPHMTLAVRALVRADSLWIWKWFPHLVFAVSIDDMFTKAYMCRLGNLLWPKACFFFTI